MCFQWATISTSPIRFPNNFCQTFIIFLSSSWQVFITREQICLKRLGISNTQCWRTPSYKYEAKRKRSSVRLVELPKLASIKGEKKGLCVYFLSTEIPVYTLLLALGVRSDGRDASIVTIFVMLMRNVSIFWRRTKHFHLWINCKKRPDSHQKNLFKTASLHICFLALLAAGTSLVFLDTWWCLFCGPQKMWLRGEKLKKLIKLKKLKNWLVWFYNSEIKKIKFK